MLFSSNLVFLSVGSVTHCSSHSQEAPKKTRSLSNSRVDDTVDQVPPFEPKTEKLERGAKPLSQPLSSLHQALHCKTQTARRKIDESFVLTDAELGEAFQLRGSRGAKPPSKPLSSLHQALHCKPQNLPKKLASVLCFAMQDLLQHPS